MIGVEVENKKNICDWLKIPLSMTRAGSDVKEVVFDEMTATVRLIFVGGHEKVVNVWGDSGIAMIMDICKALC